MKTTTQPSAEKRNPPQPGTDQRARIWATRARIALFSGRTGHGQTDYVTYLQMRPPAVEQLAYESFLAGFNIAAPAAPSQLSQEIARINSDMRAALTETADQLEDMIEAFEGLAGLDSFQKDTLANSRVVLRAIARKALAKAEGKA